MEECEGDFRWWDDVTKTEEGRPGGKVWRAPAPPRGVAPLPVIQEGPAFMHFYVLH